MHSEIEYFNNFVEFLIAKEVLNSSDIAEALDFVGGVEGVTSEGYFIIGYQGLARHINKQKTFSELRVFIEENVEVLKQDGDARYFFAQSLIDTPALEQDERKALIDLMPKSYQVYLIRRFFGVDV